MLHAFRANADQQAKPRTRKDIRKAVITAIQTYMLGPDALKNTKFVFSPDRTKKATQVEIAEICKTTQQTVSNILKELKEQAAKPAVGADEATPDSTPVQQTFFNVLEASFKQLTERWADVVENPRWADPSIPVADKLAAVADLKINLKKMQREIEERETKLTKAS